MANGDLDPVIRARQELLEATRRLNEEYARGELTARKYLQQQHSLANEQQQLIKGTEQLAQSWTGALAGAGRQAGAVGALVTQSLAGGFEKAGSAAQAITGTMAAMPGPIGAVASATLVVANIFDATLVKVKRLEASVSKAFTSIISGARTASQAVADIRIDSLSAGFDRVHEQVFARGLFAEIQGGFRGMGFWLREGRVPTQLDELREGLIGVVEEARRAERLLRFRQAIPEVRQFINETNRLQARRGAAAATTGARRGQFGAEASTAALELGATAEAAADAATNMGMQFDRANQIIAANPGMDAMEAMRRAAAELLLPLERLAEAQRALRAARAGEQLEQQNRAGREQVSILEAQTQLIRQQGLSQVALVDQSREQLEVQRLRREGLITEAQAMRRLQQLNADRLAQEQNAAAAAGRALQERVALPLERFEQGMRDLQTIQSRGGFRTAAGQENQAAFARVQGQQLRDFIQQARPQERMLGFTEAGTAAAAVASARAEIQERAEDPAVALRAAVEAERVATEALTRSNDRLLDAFAQLRAEGAL